MTYEGLRGQMLVSIEALRRQVADGTAPPSAALVDVYLEQLEELEATGAPLDDRVRTIRQLLCAASGMTLPVDYRVTAGEDHA